MVDAPARQNRVPRVDDAEDAVVLVEVDADIKRHACLVCGLTHSLPFYTIVFMRFRSLKIRRERLQKAFMSSDPFDFDYCPEVILS